MPNLPKGAGCCGCTACYAVCPKDAITMSPDPLGFKFPVVDPEKCIECKACERVCPFHSDYSTEGNFEKPVPYGARLKNIPEMMKSRSGGAFQAFSDWVLSRGGVVYGAGFGNHFKVTHKRAVTREERDEMRGSKYAQSDMGDTMRQIRRDLKDGLWVLFSGTPCQVEGVRNFIPKPLREKLLLVDIVCHGTPSPSIWDDYISLHEKKKGRRVVEAQFRNKALYGWKEHIGTLRYEGLDHPEPFSTYTYLFYDALIVRDSCAQCHFTNLRRPSDLTLADFWGYQKTDPAFNNDDKGASLVFVNSEKGMMVLNEVKSDLELISPDLNNCLQPHLLRPTPNNPKSDQCKREYANKGLQYVIDKYGDASLHYRFKVLIFKFRRKIRKILHLPPLPNMVMAPQIPNPN